ncbi:hypothetical protein LCGC14_0457140 [marine sediment metagenome]|uniref:Uncharacterized protein n=1 Tax=marine sediment metagenome TaxID=412755 RepID=A0A0F9SLD8_9ZZZZ
MKFLFLSILLICFGSTLLAVGMLFLIVRMPSEVWSLLLYKDGEVIDSSIIKLKNIQELYPKQEDLFKSIFESIKILKEKIPIGRIEDYNLKPSILIPDSPVTLNVKIQNNSDVQQKFIVNIINTNFSRDFEMYKKINGLLIPVLLF